MSGNPQRLTQGVIEAGPGYWNGAALYFVGEAGEVFQRPCSITNFGERLSKGLPVVGRFHHGQFLGFGVGDGSHLVENATTLCGVHGLPVSVVERCSRGLNTAVDVPCGCFWNRSHDLTRCRVQNVAGISVLSGAPFSTNPHLFFSHDSSKPRRFKGASVEFLERKFAVSALNTTEASCARAACFRS